MDPLSNQAFSHDFPNFVYQNPHITIVQPTDTPKPFAIEPLEKSEKSKKDLKKEKDPSNSKKQQNLKKPFE